MAGTRRRRLALGVALAAMLAVLIGARVDGSGLQLDDGIATPQQATTVAPFRWQRTVLIKSGESERAMQFALAVTEYVNQKYPDIKVEVYMQMWGEYGKIHWFVDFESMEQMQLQFEGLAADTGYNQMLLDVAGAFVDGHTYDTVYRNMR